MNLKTKIKTVITEFLVKKFLSTTKVVRNLNWDISTPNQPRILISYLCRLFELDTTLPIDRTHHFEINEMIRVFSRLGFCIDVIDCMELAQISKIKNTKYDVIFGFGSVFYQMTQLCPDAVSILYMTENHPSFSEREENKRKNYYYERHRKKVKFTRSGTYYTEQHLEKIYDHIIVLGDAAPFSSLYETIYSIFPTGLINKKFTFLEKEKKHAVTRKHYLWLGSFGAIHKGLDLLLDVFTQEKELHLHICGLSPKDRKFLNFSPSSNIHEYGHINIQSDEFIKLVSQCTYIILPSCSEGFSTSIATGMLHGLIPVVMKNTGFDRLNNKAFYLEDFHLDYLTKKIHEYSSWNEMNLSEMSRDIYFWSRDNFSTETYSTKFLEIMEAIFKKYEKHLAYCTMNLNT
jgi:hypothetical protein